MRRSRVLDAIQPFASLCAAATALAVVFVLVGAGWARAQRGGVVLEPIASCATQGPGAARTSEVRRQQTGRVPGGRWEYEARVPILARAPAAQIANELLGKVLAAQRRRFVEQAERVAEQGGDPRADSYPSRLTVDCASSHLTGRVLSVTLRFIEFYAGGAHPNGSYEAVTVDLQTGRRLSEAALFRPGTDRVTAVARAVYATDKAPCGPVSVKRLLQALDPNPEFRSASLALARTGLLVGFGQYDLGPSVCGAPTVVVPYAKLATALDPRLTALPPPSREPDGACVVASQTLGVSGKGSAWSVFGSAGGTVSERYRSDGSLDTALDGKIRLGLQALIGGGGKVEGGGKRAGVRAQGSLGAGLLGSAGATIRTPMPKDADQIVGAARSGRPPDPATQATLTETYLEMGVWLTAELGATAATADAGGGLDVEGVAGAKVAYERKQAVTSTYYLAVRGDVSGSANLPVGVTAPIASFGRSVSGEALVGYTVDPEDRPVSAVLAGSVSVAGDQRLEVKGTPPVIVGNVSKAARSLGAGAQASREVAFSSELELIDPANYDAFNRVLAEDATNEDRARLDDRWSRTGTMQLLGYRAETVSASAAVKGGAGVSFSLGADGSATEKHLEWAAYLGDGQPRMWAPWTRCEAKALRP